MQGLAVIAALVLAGFAWAAAGWRGSITGLTVAVLAGSGLAIAAGERGTRLSASPRSRRLQRLGGLACLTLASTGAFYGGWRWGWAWAVVGYVLGVGLLLLAGRVWTGSTVDHQIRTRSAASVGPAAALALRDLPTAEPQLRTAVLSEPGVCVQLTLDHLPGSALKKSYGPLSRAKTHRLYREWQGDQQRFERTRPSEIVRAVRELAKDLAADHAATSAAWQKILRQLPTPPQGYRWDCVTAGMLTDGRVQYFRLWPESSYPARTAE